MQQGKAIHPLSDLQFSCTAGTELHQTLPLPSCVLCSPAPRPLLCGPRARPSSSAGPQTCIKHMRPMEQQRTPGFKPHSKLPVPSWYPPFPLLQPCFVPRFARTRCRDVFCTNTEHVGRPGSADCVTCPEPNRPSQDLQPYFNHYKATHEVNKTQC